MDYINEFIKFNPSIGGHFKKHQENHDNDFIETNFNDEFENNFEEPSKISSIGEISRKTLGQAFYNKEVYEEMVERNLLTYNFGPKISTSNNQNKVSFKESMETLMNTIDETRRDELYSHEKDNCSRDCKKRGCGSVVSMDGLWKLTYKICMWEPKNPNIDHNIKEFIPNVCPEQPVYGNAFCYNHCKMVENFGYPVGLRPFLEKCGADPTAYTKEGKAKVLRVLQNISRQLNDCTVTTTVDDMQGTKYLLRNKNISNANNFTSIFNGDKGECRKDIGELTTLYRRNRGIEAVVAGGGIILSWTPLYKSEGPTQVALIMIRFLQLFFKGKSTREFENFFLSYDNICHLDELKLLRDKLALEPPFDIVWNKINKIIDPLHLRNHTRSKCKSDYNPEKVRKLFPEANLMCAEQTFTWLSRYKKIFNSMSKIHFHFMLHRIIKARNRYTEYCYKTGRKPLLPSAKLIKNVK